MNNYTTLRSRDGNSSLKINKGELLSYVFDGEELIHQKGSLGWENSDIEMFPVIGPTKVNNYIINTKEGACFQDQHGFLRELEYDPVDQNKNSVIFQKTYTANATIKNSRHPLKSEIKGLHWPYSFTFQKTFTLSNEKLKISFSLTSDKGMPFMLGYHPAFKLSGDNSEFCMVKDLKINIQEVIDKGGPSYPFFDIHKISLMKKSGYSLQIRQEGFHNMMLWTEVSNMICIEPITQYPDLETQNYSEANLRISNGEELFSMDITPFKN